MGDFAHDPDYQTPTICIKCIWSYDPRDFITRALDKQPDASVYRCGGIVVQNQYDYVLGEAVGSKPMLCARINRTGWCDTFKSKNNSDTSSDGDKG